MQLHDADALEAAAHVLRSADALLIGAGAGMGVDSGLPDFRGPEGFWKAYPPFRGRRFADISTPHWFDTDPALAWGFFGHRLGLYRNTEPHRGFRQLLQWGRQKPLGCFVFTSNVDGQFQKAGFAEEQLLECHGSIHYLQCQADCGRGIWPSDDVTVLVDEATVRAQAGIPHCPDCGAVARPNILMFGDYGWDAARFEQQLVRYERWLAAAAGARWATIEFGAGLAVPTVRCECESRGSALVRINPREPQTPPGGVSLAMGALDAIERLARLVS